MTRVGSASNGKKCYTVQKHEICIHNETVPYDGWGGGECVTP